ncbi:MAG: trypsin-like serine protease [Candidatus Lokiarchaeota archaeon]|nr:trypsin-like serine protease [Candidatus Lokiarchaeota archaeon]
MIKENKKKFYIFLLVINILGIFTYFQQQNVISIDRNDNIISQRLIIPSEDEISSNFVSTPLEKIVGNKDESFPNLESTPLQSIIGSDNRKKVSSTNIYPYTAVCKLIMTFPNGDTYSGSGAIIDGFHVLTAGHCLYYSSLGGWATSIMVIPAMDGFIRPFEYAWSRSLTISNIYKKNEGMNHDWGIITLDRNVGLYTGSFGIVSASRSDYIYHSPVKTAGYPGDKGYGEMYYASGKGKRLNIFEALIYQKVHLYDLDTYAGQSGSPVWKTHNNDPYIVSIHSASGKKDKFNIGTRIYPRLFEIIKDKLKEDSKNPPIDKADMDTNYDSVATFPASLCPRDPFEISFRVKNRGTKDSSLFKVDFYLSTDTIISTNDYLLGRVDMNIIWPFCDEEVKLTGFFPSNIPDGRYYIGWIIDSENEMIEYSESNNIFCIERQISVTNKPDLTTILSTISDFPTNITVGDPFEVSFDVINCGSKDSNPFSVDFYLSSLSNTTYSLGTVYMNSILALDQKEVKWTGQIPSSIPGGLYMLQWYIDSENQVDEISENNNYYSSLIRVEETNNSFLNNTSWIMI